MIHKAVLLALLVCLARPAMGEDVDRSEIQHLQTLNGIGKVTGSLWSTFTERGAENRPFCQLAAELTGSLSARMKKMPPPKHLQAFQKQLGRTLDTSAALYTAAGAGEDKQLEALGRRLDSENKELQEIWKKIEGRYR